MKKFQEDAIKAFLARMHDTMLAKGNDYAGDDTLANFKEANDVGLSTPMSIYVRLSDKYLRLKRFMKTGNFAVEDEKVEDTLLDLANYAVLMALAVQEDTKDNKDEMTQ